MEEWVAKRVTTNAEGCWLWTGTTTKAGYGQVRRNGKAIYAHRAVYEALVGPIPEGLQIDHLCRVRNCVNPLHLEPVTQRENLLRGETITARNAAKTHCPQGHAYEGDNIYRRADRPNSRGCNTCLRSRALARAARLRDG